MNPSVVSVEKMTTSSNSLSYHCIRCNLFDQNIKPERKSCGPSPVIISDIVFDDKSVSLLTPNQQVGRDGE